MNREMKKLNSIYGSLSMENIICVDTFGFNSILICAYIKGITLIVIRTTG